MIRVVMLGRLGNNLFQYAFGRALAEKHGVPLLLDASWFNSRTWPYVSPLGRLPGFSSGCASLHRPFSFGSRALRKVTGKHHWEYFAKPMIRENETDHSFDQMLLEAPADCVVMGYFQCPKYFACIEEILRAELSTHSLGLETGREELAAKLKAPGSVAVHVRRTDYVGNPNLHLPSAAFYQDAMTRTRAAQPDARFFVFSDDPEWCLLTFADHDTKVLTHFDPYDPLPDLHLMSLAHHHIIANSSYSWWAAWLGKKEGQRVFMPDRWFQSGIHAPAAEKQCEGWTMLSS